MDELSRLIDEIAGEEPPESPEKMAEAIESLGLLHDEEKKGDVWIKRYNELPSYPLDVVRDDSDTYIEALKNAIVAITKGEYGSVDYKGYKIYYDDTPHVKSVSVRDGHKEYLYMIRFHCDLLNMESYEEYHSEVERKAFLSPESHMFEKTIALLDRTIELLDDGIFIKKRKKLDIYDLKDHSSYYEYEPDDIKDILIKAFDLIPNKGYRERIETLIAEDRARAIVGGGCDV